MVTAEMQERNLTIQAWFCLSVNIPLTKARHMVEPKVKIGSTFQSSTFTRKYFWPKQVTLFITALFIVTKSRNDPNAH